MAKKPTNKTIKAKQIKTITQADDKTATMQPSAPKLPPELQKKLDALKSKLDEFKDKVLEKFGDYIVGITLLPPEKQPASHDNQIENKGKEATKEPNKDQINLMVVVDDTTSTKMTKDELHQKFSSIISKFAEETDKNILVQSVLLTDIWQSCYDAKYDLNRLISLGAPIHDTGMLAAIKISEMNSKITSLTEDLKDKEFRILLLQAKDHTRIALVDVSEKNFGIANQEISSAREILSRGMEGISEKVKVSFGRIDSALVEIQGDMDALNIKVKDKINTVIREIDKALMSGI